MENAPGDRPAAPAPGQMSGRHGTPLLARNRLLDPVHLIAVPSILVLLFARDHGMTTRESAWLIIGAYLLSHVTGTVFAARFPPGTSRSKPVAFLVLLTGTCGIFLYVVGWGALLAVALAVGVTVVVNEDGARYGGIGIVVVLLTILAGEIAVALGIVSSMLPAATSHGLAFVAAATTTLLIGLLMRGQREKELAQTRETATEERFRALVQFASDAILIVEDGGTVKYASPAVEGLFGCAPEELRQFDMSWIDPDHVDAIVDLIRRLRGRAGATESADVPIRRPDGASRWVEVHFTNLTDDPAIGGYVCNLRDIGERRVVHQRLVYDAQHDAVTQLPNRRLFLEHLERTWRDATPDDLIALLFIDVDHFKQINDRLGHPTGDLVLVAVAQCLSAVVRPRDVVARFAGDEFTVLLTDLASAQAAYEVAERITTELSKSRPIDGHRLTLSVSVGVSVARGKAATADELLGQADEAMYSAKQNGRGRWESFDHTTPRVGARVVSS